MSLIFQSMVQHEWHQWILARATQIKPLNIVQSIEWRAEHWPLQKPFIAENLFSFTERQACHFKRWIPFILSCAVVVVATQAAGLTVISLPKVTLFILIVFVRPLVGRRDTSSSPGLSTTRSVSSISRDFRWSRPLKSWRRTFLPLLSVSSWENVGSLLLSFQVWSRLNFWMGNSCRDCWHWLWPSSQFFSKLRFISLACLVYISVSVCFPRFLPAAHCLKNT